MRYEVELEPKYGLFDCQIIQKQILYAQLI